MNQTCGRQGSQSQEVSRIIEGQRKHHLKLHHSFNAAQYQKWLEGASEGGLRPLFRSLKKSEVQTARPYLDLAVEVRPHARRAEWAGNVGSGESCTHSWHHGSGKAPAEGQVPSPNPAQPLGLMPCRRRWQSFRVRPRDRMVGAMKCYVHYGGKPSLNWRGTSGAGEVSASFPQHIDMTQYAMLAKNLVAERPIGLTHVLPQGILQAPVGSCSGLGKGLRPAVAVEPGQGGK